MIYRTRYIGGDVWNEVHWILKEAYWMRYIHSIIKTNVEWSNNCFYVNHSAGFLLLSVYPPVDCHVFLFICCTSIATRGGGFLCGPPPSWCLCVDDVFVLMLLPPRQMILCSHRRFDRSPYCSDSILTFSSLSCVSYIVSLYLYPPVDCHWHACLLICCTWMLIFIPQT